MAMPKLKDCLIVFLALIFLTQLGCLVRAAEKEEGKEKLERYPILEWEWEEIKIPMVIALWIFVACIAKICKFLKFQTYVSSYLQSSTFTSKFLKHFPIHRYSS
jgi:hypothetical protein